MLYAKPGSRMLPNDQNTKKDQNKSGTMFVCVCVCTCVWVHACVCMYMCVGTRVCMCIRMYTCACSDVAKVQ